MPKTKLWSSAKAKPSAKLSKKVSKLAKEVNRNKEDPKRFDLLVNAVAVDAAGIVQPCLTSISSIIGTPAATGFMTQGDTDISRDGNHIICKSIQARMQIQASSIDVTNTIRVILLRDDASSGVAPTVTTVLENANIFSPYRFDTLGRFKILYDKTFTACYQGDSYYTYVKMSKRLPNKKTTFLGNAGTPADLGNNQYYWLYLSDSGAAPNPAIVLYQRLRFMP